MWGRDVVRGCGAGVFKFGVFVGEGIIEDFAEEGF